MPPCRADSLSPGRRCLVAVTIVITFCLIFLSVLSDAEIVSCQQLAVPASELDRACVYAIDRILQCGSSYILGHTINVSFCGSTNITIRPTSSVNAQCQFRHNSCKDDIKIHYTFDIMSNRAIGFETCLLQKPFVAKRLDEILFRCSALSTVMAVGKNEGNKRTDEKNNQIRKRRELDGSRRKQQRMDLGTTKTADTKAHAVTASPTDSTLNSWSRGNSQPQMPGLVFLAISVAIILLVVGCIMAHRCLAIRKDDTLSQVTTLPDSFIYSHVEGKGKAIVKTRKQKQQVAAKVADSKAAVPKGKLAKAKPLKATKTIKRTKPEVAKQKK